MAAPQNLAGFFIIGAAGEAPMNDELLLDGSGDDAANEGHVVDNVLTRAAACVLSAATAPLNLLDICAALIRSGFPAPSRESLAAVLGPVLNEHREAFACRDGRWTMAV